MGKLDGRVALVAGATRGAGRGIACMLGEAGATVYCTGRSVRGALASGAGRPETIEETAELVDAHGGNGIHVRCDHTVPAEVETLFARVREEQGRLDVLVNDIWGGDALTEWGTRFWQADVAQGITMMERAIHTHVVTSRYGVPLMLDTPGPGLLVEITDGVGRYYRGNLFYDFCKAAPPRLAYAMACDLRGKDVTALALTPGFLRSEAVLEHFGVTADNWRDAVRKDPHFAESETPFFVGRAVVALATDPDVAAKGGGIYAAWNLAEEYGFDDVDGRRPHFARHLLAFMVDCLAKVDFDAIDEPRATRSALEAALDAAGLGHVRIDEPALYEALADDVPVDAKRLESLLRSHYDFF